MAIRKKKFNLNSFIIDDDEVKYVQRDYIPVWKPRGVFRVHPDEERSVRVWAFFNNQINRWVLVHPTVAKRFRIPNLMQTDLYEVIDSQGNTEVIPAAHYKTPGYESYLDTLETVIRRGRAQWIKMQTHDDDHTHTCTPCSKRYPDPVWPEHDFEDVIEQAFEGRIIDSDEIAENLFQRKGSRTAVVEED